MFYGVGNVVFDFLYALLVYMLFSYPLTMIVRYTVLRFVNHDLLIREKYYANLPTGDDAVLTGIPQEEMAFPAQLKEVLGDDIAAIKK